LVEQLFEGQGEAVARKVIDAALAGNLDAAKLVLDRISPVRNPKDRPIRFALPPRWNGRSQADIASGMAALMRAVASGQVAPAAAADVEVRS
jgi:hypothetical protein